MIPTYHPGRRPTALQQTQWTGSVILLASLPRAVHALHRLYNRPGLFIAVCVATGAAIGALATERITRPTPWRPT